MASEMWVVYSFSELQSMQKSAKDIAPVVGRSYRYRDMNSQWKWDVRKSGSVALSAQLPGHESETTCSKKRVVLEGHNHWAQLNLHMMERSPHLLNLWNLQIRRPRYLQDLFGLRKSVRFVHGC